MINFAHFKLAALPALIVMVTSGCTLQPEYKRPEVPVTKEWNDKSTHGAVASELAWSEFFSDPTLRRLIILREAPAVLIPEVLHALARVEVAVRRAVELPILHHDPVRPIHK